MTKCKRTTGTGRAFALGAIGLVFLTAGARSEVADSSPAGFRTKLTLAIAAPPDEVYRRLIRNVGDWWSPDHTFSGDSHNLSIEEKAGGCFCEKLPSSGGVKHLEVVYLAPGKAVVLRGALGPLQSLAAEGSIVIQLAPAIPGAKPETTKLDVSYSVTGYLPAGMNTWAAPVDSVLTQQFMRLKNYVEHGDPAPKQ